MNASPMCALFELSMIIVVHATDWSTSQWPPKAVIIAAMSIHFPNEAKALRIVNGRSVLSGILKASKLAERGKSFPIEGAGPARTIARRA